MHQHREIPIRLVGDLQELRRQAVQELDEARIRHLAAPSSSEEESQALGALVRQLGAAIDQLADAVRTMDQLVGVRTTSKT